MATFIEGLNLETMIVNLLSGSPEIFAAIAILVISGLAAFFRMTTLTLFFMLGIFVLMFSAYIGTSFVIIFAMIGGLFISYWISRLVR